MKYFIALILTFFAFENAKAEILCANIFSATSEGAHLLDRQQDAKIFGKMTYVTDGLGTLQRINPSRAFWAITNQRLEPSVSATRQLQVIKSLPDPSDVTTLRLVLENPEKILALEMGSKLQFQRDDSVINMRLNREIDLKFTDGLSFSVGSRDLLEMKVIIGASSRRGDSNGAGGVQHFENVQVFESPFEKISKEAHGEPTRFFWKTFKGINNQLHLSDDLIINHVWIVFKNPGKLKNLEIDFSGPVYAIQDIFGEHQNTTPEKYWRGIGRSFRFDQFMENRPKYLSEPVSETFKNKIRNNLFSSQNQKAALQALKSKTLENELKNLGFEYQIFQEKFEPSQFFKFFSHVESLKIPIESGEFGDYHGREAHALQIYAMTRGMSEAELTQFKNLYREIGHNAAFGWKIWATVFDGPDPRYPTSPRYWKILELE